MSICTLEPFTKVLCRDGNKLDIKWTPDIFLYYNPEHSIFPFICAKNNWAECIPYEGNEHLAFTGYPKDDNFVFGDKVLVTSSLTDPKWEEAIFIEKSDNRECPYDVLCKKDKMEKFCKYCRHAEKTMEEN